VDSTEISGYRFSRYSQYSRVIGLSELECSIGQMASLLTIKLECQRKLQGTCRADIDNIEV
jgi:hypothetical protein